MHISTLCQGHLLIEGHEESILAKIRKSKDLDESVVKAVEKLKKLSTRQLQPEEWSEEQRLMLFRGKAYCYGTASYLFDLINYASLILLNKLSILFHPIIVWPCGQYYKVQGWAHV